MKDRERLGERLRPTFDREVGVRYCLGSLRISAAVQKDLELKGDRGSSSLPPGVANGQCDAITCLEEGFFKRRELRFDLRLYRYPALNEIHS